MIASEELDYGHVLRSQIPAQAFAIDLDFVFGCIVIAQPACSLRQHGTGTMSLRGTTGEIAWHLDGRKFCLIYDEGCAELQTPDGDLTLDLDEWLRFASIMIGFSTERSATLVNAPRTIKPSPTLGETRDLDRSWRNGASALDSEAADADACEEEEQPVATPRHDDRVTPIRSAPVSRVRRGNR